MRKKYKRMLEVMALRDAASPAAPADWSVYMLRCGDGSLYTGIAKDVEARLGRHSKGRGAAYTRSRLPLALVHREPGYTRSQALVREAKIKALSRGAKENLLKTGRSARKKAQKP